MPKLLGTGTKKRHTRRKIKYTKKRQSEMIGGGWLWTNKNTKFAYMLANIAYTTAIKNTDFDDKIKELISRGFRKLFLYYFDNYLGKTTIKIDSVSKSMKDIYNSIQSFKQLGSYNYEIEKFDPEKKQLPTYLEKFKSCITEFIELLKKNSTYNTGYSKSLSSQSNTYTYTAILNYEKYIDITFYVPNDNAKVSNFLYRMDKPIIGPEVKDDNLFKKKNQYKLCNEFLNNTATYAKALNLYSYLCSSNNRGS